MFKWFKNKCFLFHDWGRFEFLGDYRYKRICVRCGKVREERY